MRVSMRNMVRRLLIAASQTRGVDMTRTLDRGTCVSPVCDRADAASGECARRHDDGHDHRFDGRRSAGRHGHGHSRGDRATRFVAVSDERGAFRLPVRVGTVSVDGWSCRALRRSTRAVSSCSSARPVVVNLQMMPSAVQESVTVTGEAPLVDTRRRRSAATSIRDRCRSCRSTAGTGWTRHPGAGQPAERGEQHSGNRARATRRSTSTASR